MLNRIGKTVAVIFAAALCAAVALVATGLNEDVRPRDAALVLGSKVERTGVPSDRLAARLDRGAMLYATGIVKHIITSGAIGKEGFDEALVMRDYLVRVGVPAAAIIVDSGGVDTDASARNCARLAKAHRLNGVIVVTQYFHVPRTRMALGIHGIEHSGASYARYVEPRDLYSIAREVVALPLYWLSGRNSRDARLPPNARDRPT